MPFFRKKRPNTLTPQQPATVNGLQNPTAVKTPVKTSPLSNFISSPELSIEVSNKTKKNLLRIDDLILWAKEYFMAYLKCEGIEDLALIWEKVEKLANSTNNTQPDEQYEEDVAGLKKDLEKISQNMNLSLLNDEDENFNAVDWIPRARNRIRQFLQEEYMPRYFESKFHIKYQVDFYTNGCAVSLQDILSNQNALFYFMEFVDQESVREVLEFCLGANNFIEQFMEKSEGEEFLKSFDLKLAQSDAMVLYEKYISLQAPQPLGFKDEIRSEVERLICSNEEIRHCFDSALAEALTFLHVNYLEGFLKSSVFFSFLSELINSLKAPDRLHKRSESTSTCSSSSASLTPPNANSTSQLHHRQNKPKLSLGRVTSLGKFEADSDTDLELLKQESGIAKTVKKLVNYEEKEKAKEELAWQVAAMIVNEVTSITMGSGEFSNDQ